MAELKFASIASAFVYSLASPQNEVVPASASAAHFIARDQPRISLFDYIHRCFRYVPCSRECFIFALVYLRRAAKKGFPVNNLTVHRLFITALVVAIKFHEDFHSASYKHLANVGGVKTHDLTAMELKFFAYVLEYQAKVELDEYYVTCQEITHCLMRTSGSDDDSDNGLSQTDVPSPSRSVVVHVAKLLHEWTRECQVFLPRGAAQLLQFGEY